MFTKILIANRGEIACRIATTAKQMGIRTVAVFSEIDKNAKHVEMCDEAFLIGPAAARDSYLNIDIIIQVALKSGSQAIHPGYGFLSENADFADACEKQGIAFIGPPAAAIRSMGSKSQSKKLMSKAGVPLVPGYHGDNQSNEYLLKQATILGFPLLIKASAGGGGKGMRVVNSAEEFDKKLTTCRRESRVSFNNERLLLERFLPTARHVEIQVFADIWENVVYLFERDCSIQRRFQKVLEEAPAPGLNLELRQQMGQAAVNVAIAINYVGAGTVEFLLQPDGTFYFMEMNTRLQVEHPVTEMICAQDLVQWQLLVASGLPLPLKQQELTIRGHAIEVRINAEDVKGDFMPATGKVYSMQLPQLGEHVRVDTGIRQGDEVSIFYDPMLAKLIVWHETREQAILQLRHALNDFHILGLKTNIQFLLTLCELDAFKRAEVDTHFIKRHESSLLMPKQQPSDEIIFIAAIYVLLQRQDKTLKFQDESNDPGSPWELVNGWRMNLQNTQNLVFRLVDQLISVDACFLKNGGFTLTLAGNEVVCDGAALGENIYQVNLDDYRFKVRIQQEQKMIYILFKNQYWEVMIVDSHQQNFNNDKPGSGLTAPMPGSVIELKVDVGDQVKKGDDLVVIEAMKMEHTISAPEAGIIEAINYSVGDQVKEGEELLSLSS